MKICLFLLSFYFGCSVIAYGQMAIPARFSRELTPARGHYKALAARSPQPGFASQRLDSIKYPFDKAMAAEALSEKPVYLRTVSLDDLQLPAPPANSSQQTRAELDYLLALQNSRNPEDVRSSLYLSNVHETPSDVGRKIGYWAGPQNLPMTDSLFSSVSRDADYFLWSIKFKYCRPRPYMLDPRIHDLETSQAASYPSGHVTYAYIHAYIYQELAPEFTDLFIQKAYAMAHAREIIGVHYPSDSEVSRIFARKFVNLLFRNEQFLRDFENVKKEWEAKRYH
ncbi:MAG: phosphatase PAP2 family protein [Bacteroidetes bacterium]|nr:phosphatase PAP2 family protein [Bacteroidota bacterium]